MLPSATATTPTTATFVLGLDLGQAADYSALAILEHAGPDQRASLPRQDWNARHLRRWPLGTPYPAIVADVVTMLLQPPLTGRATLALDATGVGRPVVDLFRAALRGPLFRGQGRAPRLVPITITGGHQVTWDRDTALVPKRDLAGVVQVALQGRRLKLAPGLPDTPVLVAELQNFRVKISLAGHDSYGAGAGAEWRVGAHDDLVLAVSCALWTAEHTQPGSTIAWL